MSHIAEAPLARSDDLIIEELGDEILIYDTGNDRAHSLSSDAAKVWRACDGETSVEDLSANLGIDSDTVARALDELSNCELLEQPPTLAPAGEGSTRREVTIKFAKVGAAAAVAPMIISVAAPTPAMAATLGQCVKFSSGNCGGSTGCSKSLGCCCCVEPLLENTTLFPGTGYAPGSPCSTFSANSPNCKTCIPCPGTTTGGATDPLDCRFYGAQQQQPTRSTQCSAGDCP